MKYLLDASALYPLVFELRDKILDYIDVFAALDLTVYEVGNVIWKEFRRGRIRNLDSISMLLEEIFNSLHIINIPFKFSELVKLADEEDITVYDAAYLYVSRKYGYKLVTEDRDLKQYPEAIDIKKLISEISRKKS